MSMISLGPHQKLSRSHEADDANHSRNKYLQRKRCQDSPVYIIYLSALMTMELDLLPQHVQYTSSTLARVYLLYTWNLGPIAKDEDYMPSP